MRASLLINLSQSEAEEVRLNARLQRRTVSGYVVNILMVAVELVEELAPPLKPSRIKQARHPAPRTTLHIYSSDDEGKRIRQAATLANMTLSGFVLSCLHRSWKVQDTLPKQSYRKGN